MRPDNDVRLSMRVKRLRLRQRVLDGTNLLSVEWYPSLRAAIHGLEKNTFAGLDYNPWLAAAGAVGLWLLVFPYLAVWKTSGRARWLLLGTIGTHAAHFVYANRSTGWRAAAYFAAFPLSAALFSCVVLRSTWLALARGGIYWRSTFYPLPALREQTGLEGIPDTTGTGAVLYSGE